MGRKHTRCFVSASLVSALFAAAPAHGQTNEQPPPAAPGKQPSIKQIKQQLAAEISALAEQRQAIEEQEKKYNLQRKSIDTLRKQLANQKRELEHARRRLDALKSNIEAPAKKDDITVQAPALPAEQSSPPEQAAPAPSISAPVVVQSGQPAPKVQAQPSPERPVGQRPQQSGQTAPPPVAAIFEQPGALTPHGRFVLEPSLQYSYASTYRVALLGYTVIPAITIGLIDIRGVNDSTWITALTGRYGVTNRFELEFKVPYVSRNDSTITRTAATPTTNDSVFDTHGEGLGDLEFAARYQVNVPNADSPYYIAGLRMKARNGRDPFSVPYSTQSQMPTELPTGSGFVAWQPSLSIIYPTDPAVFFGGVNYVKNVDRDVGGGRGEVHPGNAVGLNFGMGLALNEKTSFSIGVEYTHVGTPSTNGGSLMFPAATPTQLSTLLFGYSYRVNANTSVNFSVGAGLTPDTPGVTMMLRMPLLFLERPPMKRLWDQAPAPAKN
ncbi:MAG: acetate kinase [Pseudomonadota bacterium]